MAYFPTGACGLDVCSLPEGCSQVSMAMKWGAQQQRAHSHHPVQSGAQVCAFENKSLGLPRGCSLGQPRASVPLIGHCSDRHLAALWTGDKDKEQLEPKSHGNRASRLWGLAEITCSRLEGRKQHKASLTCMPSPGGVSADIWPIIQAARTRSG